MRTREEDGRQEGRDRPRGPAGPKLQTPERIAEYPSHRSGPHTKRSKDRNPPSSLNSRKLDRWTEESP